jgi:hypothetical protein
MPRPSWLNPRLTVPAALLALSLSCSNRMPEKPLVLVQVAGSVRERETALAGAMVTADSWGRGGRREAITDTSGAFSMELAEGDYEIFIEPPQWSGLDPVHLRSVPVRRKSPRIDYVYTGIRVRGTILSPTGAPLDSGTVSFDGLLFHEYAYGRVRNGQFSLLIPRADEYRVHVSSWVPGLPSRTVGSITIAADTTMELHVDAVLMSGTTWGPEGSGLEGVTIAAESPDFYSGTTSKLGGAYQFWVAEGGCRFRIFPPSNMRYILPRVTPFVPITGPLSLDFSLAGTRWTGFVRSSVDSGAIAGAAVSVQLAGDYYQRSAVDTTGADGRFEVILETGKEYDLLIYVPALHRGPEMRGLFATADTTLNLYVDVPAP